MKDRTAILILALALIVISVLANLTLFILWRGIEGRYATLQQIQATQEQSINTFVSQLQKCETLEEIDTVLKLYDIKRE